MNHPAGRTWPPPGPALAIGAAVAVLASALAVAAAPPPASQRPTGRTTDCYEGGCHADVREHAFMHGPTAIGACDPCHVYDDPAKHTFRLKREGADLCGFCHVGQQTGRYTHQPVADGECVDCHDPHGSAGREMLRSGSVGDLCAACHADVVRGMSFAHGPVASGNCAACHDSHASDYPHLLPDEGRSFCVACHKEMGEQMDHVKFLHQPAEGECMQCHEPHASNHRMQLKEDPLPLCLSCHPQVRNQAVEAPYKHTVVITGEACLNCHTSHGSDMARLMKSDTVRACLECHDEPIVEPGGDVVAAVKEVADPDLYKHGPIRDGNCSGCHALHGGKVSRLLAKPYPDTFYQPYETEKYALCFSCHDEQLALEERTETLTRFRNGDVNLHYLHTNKPRQGRSCRACHSTHASKYPMHIRETVPFGQWQMPISFTATRTGGNCTPGCHREAAYDRVMPVPPPGELKPGPAPAGEAPAKPAQEEGEEAR